MLLPGLPTPAVVAHQGGAHLAGGDVLAGIDAAAAAAVPMVELDVRRTADGVLAVHHGGAPGELSLAGVGAPDLAPLGIHRLADALEHAAGRVAVDLELKEAGYEPDVVALARDLLPPERLVVTSFLDDALRAVRTAAPGLPTGLLVGRRVSLRGLPALASDLVPFGRLRSTGATFLAPSHHLDAVAMRRRAAARGIPLLLWTVNEPEKLAAALADARLAGVVTDRFDLAQAVSPP